MAHAVLLSVGAQSLAPWAGLKPAQEGWGRPQPYMVRLL